MQQQREKIKEEFWAKFVEPADIRLRAMTGNNEALLIRGTAKELWEFIDEKLDNQLQGTIKELEEGINKEDLLGKQSTKRTYRIASNDALLTAIKIVKKYKCV